MKLISNLSMRGKLLALAVPALLVILYFAITNITQSYGKLVSMQKLHSLARLAEISDPLTEALQQERGRSAVFFASEPGGDKARQASSNLARQREETDALIADYRTGIEAITSEASFDQKISTTIDYVRENLESLNALRRSIDNRSIAAGESATRYTDLIMGLINRIPLLINRSTTPELTRNLTAYYGLAEMAERAGRERAVGASLIRSRNYDLPTLRRIAGLGGQQDAYLNGALAMLPEGSDLRQSIEAQTRTSSSQSLESQRETLFSGASEMDSLKATDWFTIATQRIDGLNQARQELLARIMRLESEGAAQARKELATVSSIAGGAILMVIFIVTLIIRTINSQVKHLLDGVQHAAHHKDLSREITVSSQDEIGTISIAVNDLLKRFGAALMHIDKSSVQLATATEETNSTANQNSTQVKKQQQQIEQAAAATEEMSTTSEEISRNTVQVADAAKNAMDKSRAGEQVLNRNLNSIRSLTESVQKVNGVIGELEERSSTISDVVDVIRKVADQTNLLALNAAIEAARAGEHGRGFAVVADEVRTLAQQTHQSTTQIEEIIFGFRDITENASRSITESHELASATSEQAAELERTFADILTDVNSIADMASQIATASEEQVAVTQELANGMESVSEVAILTLSGSQEISQVTQEQAKLARQLQDLANEFRVTANG